MFVSHSSALYGSERSLLTLVTGLQQRAELRSVVLLPREGPLADLMRDAGIPLIFRRHYGWLTKKPRRAMAEAVACVALNSLALARAFRGLRALRPLVVYTNTLYSPFGAMISASLRTPHIWHAREFVHEDMGHDYRLGTGLSMALIGRSSSRVICNSVALKEKLAKVLEADMIEVVYNGFDFDSRPAHEESGKYDRCVLDAGTIDLLMVGSIHSGKGQEDAIRALSALAARGRAVRLSLAGLGTEEYVDFLKSLARRLSVEDRVSWCGFVEDTATLFADAAMLLVCSRSEAFGRVAVEAMAAHTPVVGTSSGGLLEIIQDGVTGLLYEPGDHEALVDQVERLLLDRNLYESISRSARRSVVARFDADRYVSEIERIIKKVAAVERT